jgi:hypothetical protein
MEAAGQPGRVVEHPLVDFRFVVLPMPLRLSILAIARHATSPQHDPSAILEIDRFGPSFCVMGAVLAGHGKY